MKGLKTNILFILIIAGVFTLTAQDKSALENQRKYLLDEIVKNEGQLKKTKAERSSKLAELKVLNKKITARKSLLSTLQKEIRKLNINIDQLNIDIAALKTKSQSLENEYAKMLRSAYKYRNSNSAWLFVFSAESFDQAVKRIQYLRQYSNARKKQYDIIQQNKITLEAQKSELIAKVEEKQNLSKEEEKQKSKLEQEKQNKDEIVKNISKMEKDLLAEISQKKKSAANLRNKIQAIIKAEMAAFNKANNVSTAKKTGSKLFLATPEAKALTKNFSSNKGKLPWPVDKGHITDYFGTKAHPFLKRIKTKNNGIDIATESDAKVKAIFAGQVVNVFSLPTINGTVIINHGDYYTVYANLKETFVKTGDKVKTREAIGIVNTNEKEQKTEVHLEVWKGQITLNPSLWLAKK